MVTYTTDPKMLELLICPVTGGELHYDKERQELVSKKARLAFPIRDGIPIMEMEADWDSIMQAPTESLVNALAIMAPFGTAEKQALLEAPDIVARAATLVALTERSLMEHNGDDKPLN